MRTISFQQSREVDRVAIEDWGMSGLVLMENAGRNVAERLASLYSGKRFLILCGKGNNGGDGFVIARHLQLLDCYSQIIALTSHLETLSPDASVNANIARLAEIPMRFVEQESIETLDAHFDECDVIVDCLLGTGVTGGLREPIRSFVLRANQSDATRIAVDVPTGWPVDDLDPVVIQADRTLTFVAAKDGMEDVQSATCLGELEVISIGVPRKLLQQLGIA